MGNILNSMMMGVVEGITEFLPISSTGHLILTKKIFNFNGSDSFEIFIQLGGVCAILCFYFEMILAQLKEVYSDGENNGRKDVYKFWLSIFISFVPAAAVGLLLHKYITKYLFNITTVACSLIIGGVVMLVIDRMKIAKQTETLHKITTKQAISIGFAQLLSLVPGVSRSASTIMGGMLAGLDRPTATGYSFMLSIPTLGAASIYSLLDDLSGIQEYGFTSVTVGFVTSFIISLISIQWLLKYISNHSFYVFAIYRIILGVIIGLTVV